MVVLISCILSLSLLVFFFLRDYFKIMSNKKAMLLLFILFLSSIVFIYKPLNLAYMYIKQKTTILYQAKFKKILTSDYNIFYQDIFYTRDNEVDAVYHSYTTNDTRVKKIDINTGNVTKDLSKNNYSLNRNLHSPYTNINIKVDDYYTVGKTNENRIIFYSDKVNLDKVDLLDGNEYSLSKDNVYYTKFIKNEDVSFSLYKKNLKSKKEERISPLNSWAYSPYYWNKTNTLLYLLMNRDETGYKVQLVLQKEKTSPIQKVLTKGVDNAKMIFFKFDGNATGHLLAIVGNNSPIIHFINIENLSFRESDLKKKKNDPYKFGFDVGLNNISKIFSIAFSPTDPMDFLLLATPNGKVLPQIFHYELLKTHLYQYNIKPTDIVFSFLFLLIFLSYIFIYRYLKRFLY